MLNPIDDCVARNVVWIQIYIVKKQFSSWDYCTDNKIVYVRMDKDQKLFLDPVPRNSTMVRKTIINRTSQSVVLKEVIDAKEGEHDIATTELEQLESRKSHVLEMDPEGEHRKYFMKLIDDPREIEITEHLKTSKKSWEVTFDASGNLSFGPTFLLGSYMRGFGWDSLQNLSLPLNVNGISVKFWQL